MDPEIKSALFYHISQMLTCVSTHSDDEKFVDGWNAACKEINRTISTITSIGKELKNGGNPDNDQT